MRMYLVLDLEVCEQENQSGFENKTCSCTFKNLVYSNHCLQLNTLNTFYLRLYGVRHMVKDHSDSERKPVAAT